SGKLTWSFVHSIPNAMNSRGGRSARRRSRYTARSASWIRPCLCAWSSLASFGIGTRFFNHAPWIHGRNLAHTPITTRLDIDPAPRTLPVPMDIHDPVVLAVGAGHL